MLKIQNKERALAVEKLRQTMNYKGMFPVLVIGAPGTGKTHWIEEITETNEGEYYKKGLVSLYAGLSEDTREFWINIFKEAHGKVLLVEEIEKLPSKSQDILFEALSTRNGAYGFAEKTYRFVLVFTSTFPIAKLREDRRFLSQKFFDRISQFVVRFPDFNETQRSIYEDFKATWEKMKFKEACPGNRDIKIWLEKEAHNFHGNFRDLDKIVVNWNFLQLNKYEPSQILDSVKKEFKELLHNPQQLIYDDNIFVFDEDTDYDAIIKNFRAKLKKWAIKMNENSPKKAAQKLKISHRTMERW